MYGTSTASNLRLNSQNEIQKTLQSSTRVGRFGQRTDFHIWSYSAVWMVDNEAARFQHSWHFDWEIHCWERVVGEWCHPGEPKRSRSGIQYSSPWPSSSGYDLKCLNTSVVHDHIHNVWHIRPRDWKALWTDFSNKLQTLWLWVGSKCWNEGGITVQSLLLLESNLSAMTK